MEEVLEQAGVFTEPAATKSPVVTVGEFKRSCVQLFNLETRPYPLLVQHDPDSEAWCGAVSCCGGLFSSCDVGQGSSPRADKT